TERYQGWIFLVTVILLAACGANTEPVIVTPLPGLASAVFTHTLTPLATATIEILPTVTLAPTDTPIPVESGAEPTLPLLPTRTLAPATQTATFQPAQAGLEIEYFITNDELLAPGDNATLFWRVQGANTVRIFRLNVEGRRTQVWDVESEGRLTVSLDTTDEDIDGVNFLLQAEAGGSAAEATLLIETDCPFSWFFQPSPEECPIDSPLPIAQVEQEFENGLMLWLGATREIYILYNDGVTPTWQQFEDTFEEGMPDRDDTLVAPPERLQPIRGFGLIWRQNDRVRERLGWAVQPELGYDGIIQTAEAETVYLRVLDGGIVALAPNGDSWELLPFTEIPLEETTPESETDSQTESEPSSEQ
ncbi:MAG TPA: hypothetical protein VJZ27_12235, partial [Aggregatilineales bacterium]|nr:hypothetical protein [Aggregatilineales bacterium]